MLNFFRTYQRYFFIVITAVIVLSFSFFGTFNAMSSANSDSGQKEDVIIGKKIDGSNLMRHELETLSRFISTSIDDREMLSAGKIPNLLNDGVVRKEFLQTGFAGMLVQRHMDTLKPDREGFASQFLDLISECILNAACMAEKKGISISDAEVKADLIKNGVAALQLLGQKESEMPDFNGLLRVVGMDVSTAVKTWKKVMLFRKLFQESRDKVALDSPAQNSPTYSVDLPQELKFTDFRSMLKLQVYLDSVYRKTKKTGPSSLLLPTAMVSVEDAEKEHPELVQREFQLEYCAVKKEELASGITLKETWEWELLDNNWALLEKEFPALASSLNKAKGKTAEEIRNDRFAALEAISPDVRFKIDQSARAKIISAHPEWIDEALQRAPMKQITVELRTKEGDFPFKGIADRAAFLKVLESVPLKEDRAILASPLQQYSGDGQHYYRIDVLKRGSSKRILTFAAALSDGTLDHLLDKQLEGSYFDVRKKDPAAFFVKEGQWKPFKEVRDEVGARVYADLLTAIQESLTGDETQPKNWTLDTYPRYRFYSAVKEAKRVFEQNTTTQFASSFWIGEADRENSVDKQWRLNKVVIDSKSDSSLVSMEAQRALMGQLLEMIDNQKGHDRAI